MKRDRVPAMATSSERGFVIVAVLWILMALSMLAIIFSAYLSGSARALSALFPDLPGRVQKIPPAKSYRDARRTI